MGTNSYDIIIQNKLKKLKNSKNKENSGGLSVKI